MAADVVAIVVVGRLRYPATGPLFVDGECLGVPRPIAEELVGRGVARFADLDAPPVHRMVTRAPKKKGGPPDDQ